MKKNQVGEVIGKHSLVTIASDRVEISDRRYLVLL